MYKTAIVDNTGDRLSNTDIGEVSGKFTETAQEVSTGHSNMLRTV